MGPAWDLEKTHMPRDVDSKQPWRAVRTRTVIGAAVGLLLGAFIESFTSIAQLQPPARVIVALSAVAVLDLLLAALALWAGRQLPKNRGRYVWLFVGVSLLGAAIRNGAVAAVVAHAGAPGAYLAAAAPAVLLEYGAIIAAAALYVRRLRGRTDVGWAALKTTLAVATLAAGVWFAFVGPTLSAGGASIQGWAGAVLSAGDLLGLVAPTVFVTLALVHVPVRDGEGRGGAL